MRMIAVYVYRGWTGTIDVLRAPYAYSYSIVSKVTISAFDDEVFDRHHRGCPQVFYHIVVRKTLTSAAIEQLGLEQVASAGHWPLREEKSRSRSLEFYLSRFRGFDQSTSR